VVFVGDAITPNQPPFLAIAELEPWQQSLDILLKEFKDFTIISGRGGPVELSAVQAQIRYLKAVAKATDRIARRNPPPEATEKLIPGLLSGLTFSPEQYEQYAQRLRAGLYQYYTRVYQPGHSSDSLLAVEEEDI